MTRPANVAAEAMVTHPPVFPWKVTPPYSDEA
jgi:hypothetical protein